MKLNCQEKEIVRKKFCTYCIKVLHGEALNYLDELKRQREREVSFSDLLRKDLDVLYSYDDYELAEKFTVLGKQVSVRNEWEELHNPEFNRVQFEAVKNEAGLNRFVMTPTKWITQMNAIGIVSKAGRYGGTYAHSDIAMSFATWISPEFQLYIMKDYRRLKTDENSRLSLNWNLNREISKLNYKIHTDAIKEKLIPPELTPAQVAYTYANEADMLNVVLFGKTAKQWKDENPTLNGNMRDAATLNQLLVLANLESYNAVLINQGKEQRERMELLRQLAVQQLQTLEMVSLNNLPKLGTDLQKV